MSQFRARAAPALIGVAGKLHSVNREHLLADQALALTDEQYLRKDRDDLWSELTNELGKRCELRIAVARDRHEQHVLAAGALNGPAAYHAAAVSQKHHFEHHRWIVSRSAGLVIDVALIKPRQINLVID